MGDFMRRSYVAILTSILILLIASAAARAESAEDAAKATALTAVAGTFSCGFDAASGYQAPGTNASVDVGGIFSITIGKDGSVSDSTATLSVDDGGAGPAVCTYASGTGLVSTPPFVGSLGSSTLNLQADSANSPLCPPGDGSLSFSSTTDGLQFIYTNAAGFVGHGSCGLAAVPKAASFQCTYSAKNATLGNGSGSGTVFFAPKLTEPSLARFAAIAGKDVYPSLSCPYVGPVGVVLFVVSAGGWNSPTTAPQGCPATPFENVSFRTTAKTIIVTAPGLANVSCEPSTSPGNAEAKIEVSPTLVNFGTLPIGVLSNPQTVTVKNVGTDTLNLLGFANAPPFGADPSACDSPLAPGASCPVVVNFVSSRKGKVTGSLSILSDGAGKTITNVKLIGTGK
jgi:hypothetical protein